MLAGTLSQAGYFMGSELIPPRDTNPKGFFEDKEINNINELILAQVLPSRPKWFMQCFKHIPRDGQRWLSRVPLNANIHLPEKCIDRVELVLGNEPFCFKDPRFSYTLPAWRPMMENMVFLVIFRSPTVTANSIIKEVHQAEYLQDFQISWRGALKVWELMYRHIIEIHLPAGGEWIFVHYDQILDGTALPRLSSSLGVKIEQNFADPKLKRTKEDAKASAGQIRLYQELCQRAAYRLDPFNFSDLS
jgi:hypothetical protein